MSQRGPPPFNMRLEEDSMERIFTSGAYRPDEERNKPPRTIEEILAEGKAGRIRRTLRRRYNKPRTPALRRAYDRMVGSE